MSDTPVSKSDDTRSLGALEELFWLYDQVAPLHFVMAAEISGPTATSTWREALDAIQRRHPLLAVRIENEGNSTPVFRPAPDAPIPLRIVQNDSEAFAWQVEIGKELFLPFDPQGAPLVRAVLLHHDVKSILLLTAHHSIADGISLTHLFHDLLRIISGETLDPLPLMPAQEELAGVVREAADTIRQTPQDGSAAENATGAYQRNNFPPIVQHLRLGSELTSALTTESRRHGTTVHGALCAAFVIAGKSISERWNSDSVRVMSPINIRRFIDPPSTCALSIAVALISVAPQGTAEFWELARLMKKEVSGLQSREPVAHVCAALTRQVSKGLNAESAWQFLINTLPSEGLVSNLGVWPFETRFGTLTLESLWGPGLLIGVDGRQILGVTTIGGSMCLLHTSYSPLPSLLTTIEKMLSAACEANADPE